MSSDPTWRDALAPGDIVAFAFPAEDDGAAEKNRPCLVLDVRRANGVAEAVVAYGTGAWTRANVGDELHVTAPDDLAATRLRKPTRFVRARQVRVPLDSPRFREGAAGTALIGSLPAHLQGALVCVEDPVAAPARRRGFHLRRPRRPWVAEDKARPAEASGAV